tara:strand:- start:76 stop:531 length:456 start_codon:yes stop_codon:yes gene_type:complete
MSVTREILESHPVVNLKKELAKVKKSLNYGKLTKSGLVDLMLKNKQHFNHIKKYEAPPRAAPKPKPKKPEPKPTPKEPETPPNFYEHRMFDKMRNKTKDIKWMINVLGLKKDTSLLELNLYVSELIKKMRLAGYEVKSLQDYLDYKKSITI